MHGHVKRLEHDPVLKNQYTSDLSQPFRFLSFTKVCKQRYWSFSFPVNVYYKAGQFGVSFELLKDHVQTNIIKWICFFQKKDKELSI